MIKNIILDFDGVILESNEIKIEGFYLLFKGFGEDKAFKISNYFRNNAGFSRYDIIRYFFLKILNEEINESILIQYATQYSSIVRDKVLKAKFVDGCKDFLLKNDSYNLFIVSSSDENDLKYICAELKISKCFNDILGSPTKKAINIKNIIDKYNLKKDESIYIGDSLNDYHATVKNNIVFIGRDSGIFDFNELDDIIIIKDLKNINKLIEGI